MREPVHRVWGSYHQIVMVIVICTSFAGVGAPGSYKLCFLGALFRRILLRRAISGIWGKGCLRLKVWRFAALRI